MYADSITSSMKRAIDETQRRREIQLKFNEEHGITPQGINKKISEGLREIITAPDKKKKLTKEEIKARETDPLRLVESARGKIDETEKKILIKDLQSQMELASANLQFELAAELRDALRSLQK